jgi:acetyl-CoA synthetase
MSGRPRHVSELSAHEFLRSCWPGHLHQGQVYHDGSSASAADQKVLSYSEVLEEVCKVANWLKSQGVAVGDAVAIYLPMLPELPIAMLACARIGAVHSVVFGGFSSEALAARVLDCKPKVLITASGVMRGAKKIELKKIADEACNICKSKGFQVC